MLSTHDLCTVSSFFSFRPPPVHHLETTTFLLHDLPQVHENPCLYQQRRHTQRPPAAPTSTLHPPQIHIDTPSQALTPGYAPKPPNALYSLLSLSHVSNSLSLFLPPRSLLPSPGPNSFRSIYPFPISSILFIPSSSCSSRPLSIHPQTRTTLQKHLHRTAYITRFTLVVANTVFLYQPTINSCSCDSSQDFFNSPPRPSDCLVRDPIRCQDLWGANSILFCLSHLESA